MASGTFKHVAVIVQYSTSASFNADREIVHVLETEVQLVRPHRRVAVDGQITGPAVAVRRVLHKGYLVSGKVNYSERESKRLRRLARGAGGEERRLERNAFHVCARLAEHADGKLRVETAAEK